MGLKVMTDGKSVMVFRKDFETDGKTYPKYTIGVSSKTPDGDWINGYIPVKFKKDVSVENMTKINIKNAFYVNSKYKDNVYTSLMITDFEIEKKSNKDDFMDIPDGIEEELPFK